MAKQHPRWRAWEKKHRNNWQTVETTGEDGYPVYQATYVGEPIGRLVTDDRLSNHAQRQQFRPQYESYRKTALEAGLEPIAYEEFARRLVARRNGG